jgi:hypothetical protein
MPLSPDQREQVVAAKRAKEWFSNYVSKALKTDADAQDAIALPRESHDELPADQHETHRPQGASK